MINNLFYKGQSDSTRRVSVMQREQHSCEKYILKFEMNVYSFFFPLLLIFLE